jgi:hypothetical protein
MASACTKDKQGPKSTLIENHFTIVLKLGINSRQLFDAIYSQHPRAV